jgi:hypothetical protein
MMRVKALTIVENAVSQLLGKPFTARITPKITMSTSATIEAPEREVRSPTQCRIRLMR